MRRAAARCSGAPVASQAARNSSTAPARPWHSDESTSGSGLLNAAIAALRANPTVAVTIDTEQFPSQSLSIRGRADIDEVDGLAPEYIAAAHRYLGDEGAAGMLASMDQPGTVQARIVVRPTWAGLLDFVDRLPSALGGVA